MTIDFNRTPRGHKSEGHLPKRNGIFLGLVRKNCDAQRMGRLLVWVSDFGPDEPEFWVPVSYASPFAGATPVAETVEDGQSMDDSQKTYGWWATPPDIDNQVLCCFLDGDVANGFWFSCVYPQNMNIMVPALGMDFPTTDSSMDSEFAPLGPPVVEYNKRDKNNQPAGDQLYSFEREKVKRPVFTPLAEGLKTQGLAKDPKRGPANTSARRESPSRSFGLLSPRGHTIHIDDGALPEGGGEPENEFIRFRTRSGAQILINETEGFIYIITKGGKSWVEISDDNIDMYSAGSINISADKDVNIRAGGKVGIHGDQAIQLASAFYSSFTSGPTNIVAGSKILLDATKDIGLKSSRDVVLDAVRDVGENAGRNILHGACNYASRNAKSILDNSGGSPPPEVDHADYERNVNSRVPLHEPFDRSGTGVGTGPTPTGVDANGNPVADVRKSDGTVVQQPVPVEGAVADRAKALYKILKAKGYSDVQIAGILGSWQQESTLNPNAKNSIGARGLAQWLGSRRTNLENYASSKGANVNSAQTQIDFFHTEKDGPDGGGAGKKLRAATTVKDAVTAMNYYERYGGWSRSNPTGGHEVGNRYQYAANHYAAIQAGKYS